jgi:hypothetical protein
MTAKAREHSFDELTRGLASGSISRRKAIRLMGAALVGGTLASFPGGAWAAKGGRSSCAKFCQSLFGANTPEEAECVSAARTGQGPCFTCTTETGCGPNFTKPTCSEGPYSCDRCSCCTSIAGSCGSNGECCSGNCSNGFCCASGRVGLSNGTCAIPCRSPAACTACGNPLGAVCFGTVDEGVFVCGGAIVGACGPEGSCPTGQFCSFALRDCVVAC